MKAVGKRRAWDRPAESKVQVLALTNRAAHAAMGRPYLPRLRVESAARVTPLVALSGRQAGAGGECQSLVEARP